MNMCRARTWVLVLAVSLAWRGELYAQTAAPAGNKGTLVDRVVAIVNGDLILDSDVDEERRFSAFEPYADATKFSRDEAVNRLIDRALILQQAKLQPGDAVSTDQVRAELQALRKDIPACQRYHCETDAGWTKFVQAQGFTVPELEERWRERIETLKFVELRFRMGIRITPEEIKGYYDKTLLPEYTRQHAVPPKLDTVTDRIQEVLLQQQVSGLLDDWLKTLRAQGSVKTMKADEVTP